MHRYRICLPHILPYEGHYQIIECVDSVFFFYYCCYFESYFCLRGFFIKRALNLYSPHFSGIFIFTAIFHTCSTDLHLPTTSTCHTLQMSLQGGNASCVSQQLNILNKLHEFLPRMLRQEWLAWALFVVLFFILLYCSQQLILGYFCFIYFPILLPNAAELTP